MTGFLFVVEPQRLRSDVFVLAAAAIGLGGAALVTILSLYVRALKTELQVTRRKVVTVMRVLPDGLASFDAQGRPTFANRQMKNLLRQVGFEFSRKIGREELLNFLARRLDSRGARSQLASPSETSFDIEYAPDRWMQVTEKRRGDLRSVIRLSDSTNRILGRAALERSIDRERGATAIYRNFVSVVSHQFRTPLAIIDSSAQRITRHGSAQPPEIVTRVEKIRKAAKRLAQLIDSTLLAYRLEEGQLDVNPRVCNFADIVHTVASHHQELAAQRTISVSICSDKLSTKCDSLLMEQVLCNLITNAVKYSPDKSPIDVRCWSDETHVHCSVSDHGIGIPADEMPRLFERFFRARTAAGFTGTGLGLNFAHHLVTLHGGMIAVRSEENVGSTFTVTLPLARAEELKAA